MRKYWLILLLFLPHLVQAQIITSIAGGGASLGDGGPAGAAQTILPFRGDFDTLGNYYFMQSSGAPRIRKISASGIITTIAGNGIAGFSGDGGPATLAAMRPQGGNVDHAGNYYVADYYNNRLRKVDAATGTINTIAGDGSYATSGDGGPASLAKLVPNDVGIDNYGNIYVADQAAQSIRKISTSGIISTVANINGVGLCFDRYGRLYAGVATRIVRIDTVTGDIDTIAGTGIATYNGDGLPALGTNLRCFDLTIDDTGNLYYADDACDRVRKIDTFGFVHTIAGNGVAGFSGDGGPAISAQLFNPEGVAIDACGNLIIADDNNHRIRKVTLAIPTIDSVTITTTTGDTACAGFPITFIAHVHGGHATRYTWIKNAVIVGSTTDSTFTYSPMAGDIMAVRATDCSGFNVTDVMTIIFVPLSVPTISITGITSTTVGTTVTVNATIAGAGSSYTIKWFRNSALFTTTTIPTLTYTKAAGTDTITARVVPTSTGCYDSTLSAPHIVTVATVAVQNIHPPTEGTLTLYPNPAQNTITLSNTGEIIEVAIFDLVGKLLLSRECNTPTPQLDISTLPTGTYLLKVTDNTGRKWIAKFNKQ